MHNVNTTKIPGPRRVLEFFPRRSPASRLPPSAWALADILRIVWPEIHMDIVGGDEMNVVVLGSTH